MEPWQEHALALFSEIDPDTGWPWYREVVFQVPRQCGKTSVVAFLMAMDRMLLWERNGRVVGQRVLWSAQTLPDCLRVWETEMMPRLEGSPLWDAAAFRASMQSVAWPKMRCEPAPGERSFLSVLAASKSSGRGSPGVGLVVMDEAQEAKDSERERSLLPTQNTVDDAQFLILGTAGTSESVFFRSKVEAGRARTQSKDGGRFSRSAYLEYSAPDDADPADPAVWQAAIPSLGFHTSQGVIQHLFDVHKQDGNLDTFKKEYLTQWVERSVEPPIPVDLLEASALGGPRVDRNTSGLIVAIDAPPEMNRCVVVLSDGQTVEMLADLPSAAQVVEVAARAAKNLSATVVGFDKGMLFDHLRVLERTRGVKVRRYGAGPGLQAVNAFTTAIVEGQVGMSQDMMSAVRRDLAGAVWHYPPAGLRRLRRIDATTNLAAVLSAAVSYHAAWEALAIPPSAPANVASWDLEGEDAMALAAEWG